MGVLPYPEQEDNSSRGETQSRGGSAGVTGDFDGGAELGGCSPSGGAAVETGGAPGVNTTNSSAGAGGVGRDDCFDEPQRALCEVYRKRPNTCVYPDDVCFCDYFSPLPYDSAWFCYPRGCPQVLPRGRCASGSEDEVNRECVYGPTKCICAAPVEGIGFWHCDHHIECPEAAPTEGEVCESIDDDVENNTCVYGTTRCSCGYAPGYPGKWRCSQMY
ncbi:MAG TPA: hypothetical protein VFQ61_00135 [Polyangiaceae bacterium]|nr:hypothetical protein [Polyangiaceae bacterium]